MTRTHAIALPPGIGISRNQVTLNWVVTSYELGAHGYLEGSRPNGSLDTAGLHHDGVPRSRARGEDVFGELALEVVIDDLLARAAT